MLGLPFLMSVRNPKRATTIKVKITVVIVLIFNYSTMIRKIIYMTKYIGTYFTCFLYVYIKDKNNIIFFAVLLV